MKIASGVTDQYIYFVAVDSTDLKTRETGLSSFTVYRSRNGGAAVAYTTPTVNETDVTNMPGVYELLLDEDMTIDAGDETQEVCLHITQASMAPVTRVFELYRPKITAGNTLAVDAAGNGDSNVTEWLGTTPATPSVAGVPEVDVTHFNGTAGTFAAGRPEVNTSHAAGTAWNSGAIGAATLAADTITAAKIAADAIGASELAADAVAEIADAIWDEDATAHQTQGTFGQAIGDPVADTNTIYKATVTDATGATVGVDVVAIKAETASILTDTAEIGAAGAGLTAINLPDQTMNITGDITGNLSGSVGSVTGAVGSVTGAVGSVTGNVGGNVTGTIGGLTAGALADMFDTNSGTTYGAAVAGSVVKEIADNAGGGTPPTAAQIADAVWDEAQADHVAAGSFGVTASEIADILVDTAEIGAAGAGLTVLATQASVDAVPTATENADALLNRDMSAVSDTNSRSPLNALRFLRNLWAIAGATLTVKKEDDTTTAWTATVTTDAAADPIIGSDPA